MPIPVIKHQNTPKGACLGPARCRASIVCAFYTDLANGFNSPYMSGELPKGRTFYEMDAAFHCSSHHRFDKLDQHDKSSK